MTNKRVTVEIRGSFYAQKVIQLNQHIEKRYTIEAFTAYYFDYKAILVTTDSVAKLKDYIVQGLKKLDIVSISVELTEL